LISNRDGISGTWQAPTLKPSELVLEKVENMLLWAPERRAQVIDFEIHSRLGFSADTASGSMNVWHAATAPAGGTSPPAAVYHPLVRMVRPSQDVFLGQTNLVAAYADLRADRASEILAQMDGMAAFLASITYLGPTRAKWTGELLDAVFRLAQFVEFRFKHALACRRPNEYSAQIQPIIPTPEHGSLPSGHATESFALADVLMHLLKASPNPVYHQDGYCCQLLRQAARVAINRQVAGVHFPVDSAAGALLGLTLGEYFVRRCQQANDYEAWSFVDRYKADEDFNWAALYDVPGRKQQEPPSKYAEKLAGSPFLLGQHSPILSWLWAKALAEWA